MKHCRIRAEVLSPLVVRENRMSSSPHGLKHLPGGSFRGAVAAKFLREKGTPEHETFRLLFIDRPVCFPNLLPTDAEGLSPSRILPMTSVSCKRHPGFGENGENTHGASDILAAKLVERRFPGFEHKQCPVCGNDMKTFSGFWNGLAENPKCFRPSMFYQRHTGIDRDTGTIAPAMFFTTQAIADYRIKTPFEMRDAPGNGAREERENYCRQYLAGEMRVTEEQFEALEPMLKGTLFAGAERTRGRGELAVDIITHNFQPTEPDIAKWSKDFKDKLETLIPIDRTPEERRTLLDGHYFSIKLESDAILVDPFLRPESEIRPDFDGVEYVMKVARQHTIKGWNAAWGLPKHDDEAVAMGSVYLFRYLGNDTDGLGDYLRGLTRNGIGLRKEEGFGQISVCDPFHCVREVI